RRRDVLRRRPARGDRAARRQAVRPLRQGVVRDHLPPGLRRPRPSDLPEPDRLPGPAGGPGRGAGRPGAHVDECGLVLGLSGPPPHRLPLPHGPDVPRRGCRPRAFPARRPGHEHGAAGQPPSRQSPRGRRPRAPGPSGARAVRARAPAGRAEAHRGDGPGIRAHRPGRGVALLRRGFSGAFAGLVPTVLSSPLGRRLGGLLGQYRIRYRAVPKGQRPPRWAADPAVGLRLPPTADNRDSLRSLGWQLHTYGYGHGTDRPVVPDWVEGPSAFGADVRGRVRSDRLYLVRPDVFVAASFPLHAGATATAEVAEALAAYDVIG